MDRSDLSALVAACEHLDKLPSPIPEVEAQAFAAEYPLPAVFQCVR
jgi:hypothetical protein